MATPKPKFHTLGKSKFVHVVYTEAYDRKNAQCQQVRKFMVEGKIDYKAKGISPEAALALDECPRCMTHGVIEVTQTPDQKRAKRKADAADLMDKIRDEQKDGKRKGKVAKVKSTAEPKPKSAKVTKTKSGTRSTGSTADAKAEALRAFCEENGWAATLGKDDATGHTVVIAHEGTSIINAFFIDGKYDVGRHAHIRVGEWTGTLRGAHAVRRQVDRSLDDRDRPHPAPGKGRGGPRKANGGSADDAQGAAPEEGESPEDAHRRVPFSLDDDDVAIIDAVKGKVIRWRNSISGNVEEAWVPNGVGNGKRLKVAVTTHPKTGRRMIDFLEVMSVGEHGEVLGPERCVALDKIIRVVAS